MVDREAGQIKNGYMIKLGSWALLFALVAAATYALLRYSGVAPWYGNRNYLLLWIGCMVGAWCSFASRKVILTFFDLARIEEDRVDPPLRLIFAGLLTVILGLIFATGFADRVVGTFHASNFLTHGSIALLIGALAGISEQALPGAITQKARSILSLDGGKAT